MITVDDLVADRSLPEPMLVKVVDVDWNPDPSRRAEVELLDSAGNSFGLIDYDGAALTVDWKPNHRYRISQCNVKKGGSTYPVVLSPSKRTEIESLGSSRRHTSLLVVGDTHVGRTRHPKTEAEIDPIDAFATAVEYGIERDVDAVVHVGDIFHESASTQQANSVDRRVFGPLEGASIPFYYVRGNHSAESGDRVLANRPGVSRLDTTGERIGSDMRVFGIDHYEGGTLPWGRLNFPDAITESIRLLVLHQTLRQLSGEKADSIDLKRIPRRFRGRFNLVLSGHHHDATSKDWNGTTVMYTGASEHMSKNSDATDRVAWFISASKTPITPQRYDIP